MSTQSIMAIRGMPDVLPDKTPIWLHLESVLHQLAYQYGYQQIRLPILEYTRLFERSVGQVTDIVAKEMYTFEDRRGDSVSLRPEGTAGCLRAYIQHNLQRQPFQRFWYKGPMFRYERPQKGRQRQFNHFGVEALGMVGPDIDAELLLMCARLWSLLGVSNKLRLQINSLGSKASREKYVKALVKYFHANLDHLNEQERIRLDRNPLRLLDSKNPKLTECIQCAPSPLDYLDVSAREHFEGLKQLLDAAGVCYEVSPHMVRGLDYYGLTVFEWVTDALGAQNAVCAGGRYDALAEALGGKNLPAVGFSIGLERLIALAYEQASGFSKVAEQPVLYVLVTHPELKPQALLIAEQLRTRLPLYAVIVDCKGGTLKAQLKQANKYNAHYAILIGETEMSQGKLVIKPLATDSPQSTLTLEAACAYLEKEVKRQ